MKTIQQQKLDPHQDKYRYEIKFLSQNVSTHDMELRIKQAQGFFKPIYYPRYVNNIYFDTNCFQSFYDNINGIAKRAKYRIRWYGNWLSIVENPTLEVKLKHANVGEKLSFPLKLLELKTLYDKRTRNRFFENSDIPLHIKNQIKLMGPVICNRYKRKYYESSIKEFRITLDSELEFMSRYALLDLENSRKVRKPHIRILELKYHRDILNADFITSSMPFRTTRSSKYICGVENLYGK